MIENLPPHFNKLGIDPSKWRTLPVDGPKLKVETKKKYVQALRGVFKFAWEDNDLPGKPPLGPLKTYRDDVRDRDKRPPFAQWQLEKIFDPAHYPKRTEPAHFWLPLLLLFTGARRNEPVQLFVRDVETKNGVPGIVLDEQTGKVLKTAQSKRFVPLHRELVTLGFLGFVESRKKDGLNARIFQELFSARRPGDAYGKTFTRFLLRIGAKTPETALHSFRHNMTQALDNVQTDGKLIERLQGWLGDGGMRRRYGGEYDPRVLKEAIDKADFGLDLTPLMTR
jgi:integrase